MFPGISATLMDRNRLSSIKSLVIVGLLVAAMTSGPSFTEARADPVASAQPTPTQAEMEAAFLTALRRLSEELAKTPDTIVAQIGGHGITRGEVSVAVGGLPPTNGTRTLDGVYHDAVQGLMAQQALAIRAREQNIDRDPGVRHRIATATDTILANEFLHRATAPAISDQMTQDAYNRDVAGKPGAEEVRARVIMTYTRQDAESVVLALAGGADFADVARRSSKDASAPVGGDIGFVRLGAVLPEIGAVMFALPPGQTTTYPVRAAGAWYIIKVEARRQQGAPSFDAVRAQLVQQLTQAALPGVIQRAMAGLPVQDYGLMGKDARTGATKDSPVP